MGRPPDERSRVAVRGLRRGEHRASSGRGAREHRRGRRCECARRSWHAPSLHGLRGGTVPSALLVRVDAAEQLTGGLRGSSHGMRGHAFCREPPCSAGPLRGRSLPPLRACAFISAEHSNSKTLRARWASLLPRPALVALLLSAHADPNLGSFGGVTPLCLAAMCDKPDLTQLLIDAGAAATLPCASASEPCGPPRAAHEWCVSHAPPCSASAEGTRSPRSRRADRNKAPPSLGGRADCVADSQKSGGDCAGAPVFFRRRCGRPHERRGVAVHSVALGSQSRRGGGGASARRRRRCDRIAWRLKPRSV